MQEEKADIYNILKKNRSITMLVVVVSGIVAIVALLLVYSMHKNHTKYVYGISDKKELMPLELIEKEDLVEIYRKGSIQLWASYFYNIDQYNYEKQIEKSFWLIDDKSGNALYKEYQQAGHFNRMIRTSSVQYIDDIKIVWGNNGAFQIKGIVTIDRPNQEEQRKYELVGQGRLETVKANYPLNPYGYLIYDYRETSKTELK
tara:strand:+ start:20902 stop:21507 length:606 start_codon:yes stop_codon:yes gene_type:complete